MNEAGGKGNGAAIIRNMLDKAPELQPSVAPPLDAVDIAALNAKHEGLIADLDRLAKMKSNADAGVIQARRILDRLYHEEQAAAAKMAAAE